MAAFGGNQVEKALQYISEGEKVLKKWTLFSSTSKNEDAAESFDKAARCYKVAKMMNEAADCYERAGQQYGIAKSSFEEAKAYMEAGKCRKAEDPIAAVDSFGKAIAIFNESGRFHQAGKMLQEVGEIYESDKKFEEAVESFESAAEYLEGENATSQANVCLGKVAAILTKEMDPPDLLKAAGIYERLGMSCTEKKLLLMNAKGYWLQAILCLLAQNDSVAARNKQSEFTSKDYTFEDSREFRFVDSLIKAFEELDVEGFSQHCFEYDQISKLDPWKMSLCLRIKRLIEAGAGQGEEEEGDEDDIDLT